MAQSPGSLQLIWETWIKFQFTDLNLTHPQLWQAFGEIFFCVYLSTSLPVKKKEHIKKRNCLINIEWMLSKFSLLR